MGVLGVIMCLRVVINLLTKPHDPPSLIYTYQWCLVICHAYPFRV